MIPNDALLVRVWLFVLLLAGTFVNILRVPPQEITQHKDSHLSVECQAASTDPNLEIKWYRITRDDQMLPVKSTFWASQGLLFMTKSAVSPRGSRILTFVTSTLTIKRLSGGYAGTYACIAVAGKIRVNSVPFQVKVSGMYNVICIYICMAAPQPSVDLHACLPTPTLQALTSCITLH